MAADSLFIDDGYTITSHIAAAPGLHPAAVVVYRPALHRERRVYGAKIDTRNTEAISAYEADTLARHVVSINGDVIPKERVAKLHPTLFAKLIDLVFSYAAAEEEADAGNSRSA